MNTKKIKRTALLLGFFLLQYNVSNGQQLAEKTALRLFEHHSSMKTDAPFGESANPDQSAYDFVNHKFVNSFDMATFRAYSMNSSVPASIDMVEHNGPFGNGGGLGFTSSESSIWAQMGPPYIRGNDQTLYFLAPGSFNYETAAQMSDIKNSFNESRASKSITAVAEGSVYLAKLRGTDQYIAIKITGVKDMSGGSENDDVYFNFNYKYAVTASGVEKSEQSFSQVSAYPNPTTSSIRIQLEKPAKQATLSVYNVAGQLQFAHKIVNTDKALLDVQNLANGVYYIQANDEENTVCEKIRFIKI